MVHDILDMCAVSPVIPVVEIDNPDLAKPLALALQRGGINIVEITLRTPKALDAIAEAAAGSDILVGAGTLLSPEDVENAVNVGAKFGVSPGTTPDLIEACRDSALPLLPGAATPSEIMSLRRVGFSVQKFFPAEQSGGIAMLEALSGPMHDVKFCPTGGVSREKSVHYLSLNNVLCVGGSWVASKQLIRDQNWQQIEENARFAFSLQA